MAGVTHTGLSGTILGGQLDTNFSDVVSIASSIGNDQLVGGITADKLTDRYALSYDTICLVAHTVNGDAALTGTTQLTMGAANTATLVLTWQPIMKTGMEAALCSITVQAAGVANSPLVSFYLNGTSSNGSLIGGVPIAIVNAAELNTLAQTDPIATPLVAMSNGDYINIYMVQNAAGTATCRGVYVTFGMKYVLQA
jgi:hypothetical protein